MERAGQSLWGALRRVARPEKPLDLLAAVWPLMVGRRLADHTRPCAWHKGCVDVAVDQPEWQSQLESMCKDVRVQINHWWGSELVREVRFVPEKAKRQSSRRAGYVPVSDTGKDPRTVEGQQARLGALAEHKLRSALKELEPALRGIADADLRDLIARVAGQYLGRQGKK
jgi:hypothetical protein